MVRMKTGLRRAAVLAACITGCFAVAASAQPPVVSSYQSPEFQALTDEQAVEGCDYYAAHPLDPMKPASAPGIASDQQINTVNAYLYCFRAFQAEPDNPRIQFQWGRVNYARNPRSPGQPRQMFRMAYRDGSEIAGVYLAQLPPEKSFAELRAEVQADIARIRREQAQGAAARPMTGQERDAMLIGSVVTIGTVALLRILSGEAAPVSECSGGHTIDINTHEMLCNGLVVGTY